MDLMLRSLQTASGKSEMDSSTKAEEAGSCLPPFTGFSPRAWHESSEEIKYVPLQLILELNLQFPFHASHGFLCFTSDFSNVGEPLVNSGTVLLCLHTVVYGSNKSKV